MSMEDEQETNQRALTRLSRKLARSEQRRQELEHLIDTGQSFQRRVLIGVEEARAELEELNLQLQQEQARTDQLLKSIMPPAIAKELKETGGVVPRRVDGVSVMFADFVGFTAHAERLDPMILVQILDHYYSEFDRIAIRFGVEKVKTIGDAYMCASGLDGGGQSATRLVNAALSFLAFVVNQRPMALAADAPLWKIRIGINSGPISTGVIGQDRLSFDIWGDTVNTASRVVEACKENEILLSRSTFDLLDSGVGCVACGVTTPKGRGPVEVFRPASLAIPYKSAQPAVPERQPCRLG